MSKPKQILLLEFLESKGLGNPINISPWLYQHFPEPSYHNQKEWQYVANQSKIFIHELCLRNFISHARMEENELNFFPQYLNVDEPQTWYQEKESDVKNVRNEFWITVLGLDYLESYNKSELDKKLIKSNTTTNKYTRGILIFTAFVSAFTLIVTGLNYTIAKDSLELNKHNSKNDSIKSINVEKRLDTLQSTLRLLQQSLTLPKNQKTYHQQKHP